MLGNQNNNNNKLESFIFHSSVCSLPPKEINSTSDTQLSNCWSTVMQEHQTT